MKPLLICLIAVAIVSAVHSIIVTWFVSKTMGDWWPFFWRVFTINFIWYFIVDWVSGYLESRRDR